MSSRGYYSLVIGSKWGENSVSVTKLLIFVRFDLKKVIIPLLLVKSTEKPTFSDASESLFLRKTGPDFPKK